MTWRAAHDSAGSFIDSRTAETLLDGLDDPLAALRAYEKERLDVTNEIVLTNRKQPPDYIIEIVDKLTDGEPFDRIEDVIDPSELEAISDRYKNIARYNLDSMKRQP